MEVKDVILNEHHVFMRVHRVNIDYKATSAKRSILPVAFDAQGEGGLSVDWSEYSTAQQTQQRARKPECNAVISIPVLGIRANPLPLDIVHVPVEDNYSHCEIFGIPPRKPSDMGVRVKLMDLSTVIIACEEE